MQRVLRQEAPPPQNGSGSSPNSHDSGRLPGRSATAVNVRFGSKAVTG